MLAFPPPTPFVRRGMSLVELLVVVAIIGVLLGLVAPAIQHAREAARRASCHSHLRQIGLALVAYHDAHATLPIGCIERRLGSARQQRQIAWSAQLLPFLEQTALHAAIDFGAPFDSPQNRAAASTVLPVYLCPSLERDPLSAAGRGPCDYGGIYGPRFDGHKNDPPRGVMLYDTSVSFRHITDGTATTLAVAEESEFLPPGEWISGLNVFDVAFPINTAPRIDNDIHSRHPGGASGLLADGAVHFLSERMATRVLSAICTRADGEPVGEF